MESQSLKYICVVCKKQVDNVNFSNIMACPFCSSKIFVKKPKQEKRTIKCV